MLDKALQLIEQLGSTKEEIAAKLTKMKIRGIQKGRHSCPIAKYLAKEGVFMSVGSLCINDNKGEFRFIYDAASEFIQSFDRGEFPELIEREEVAR